MQQVEIEIVELPYISCKNPAEVEHIRHYLQESSKYLTFQTNQSNSVRSDISCRIKRFLKDLWTDLAIQDLEIGRNSRRKCLECTENIEILQRSVIFFQDQAFSSEIPAIMHCFLRFWRWNLTDSCRKCMKVRLGERLKWQRLKLHRKKCRLTGKQETVGLSDISALGYNPHLIQISKIKTSEMTIHC